MNAPLTFILLTLLLATTHTGGQGTFVYDQQSATNDIPIGAQLPFSTPSHTVGQSFTPQLPSVEFVRLYLGSSVTNGLGETVYINLRANSITGPILGATASAQIPDGFLGPMDWLFATPVSVTPGVTYFLEPVFPVSGGSWQTLVLPNALGSAYPGGDLISNGSPMHDLDLWFREGIVAVPEPSSTTLILLGVGGLAMHLRRKSRNK
jgi:hypothetical protein